ncbi:hypothetical protein FOL47_002355, partial [Perkinsus chesapeaki]
TDQEMPAIVTVVYTDTLEVVWEQSRWYCQIEGSDKAACRVRKEDARNAYGPCKASDGGSNSSGGINNTDNTVSPVTESDGLPTAAVIAIIGGSLLVFFIAICMCIRGASQFVTLESPKGWTTGHGPLVKAPRLEVDKMGITITKPSDVNEFAKSTAKIREDDEPPPESAPRLPLAGESRTARRYSETRRSSLLSVDGAHGAELYDKSRRRSSGSTVDPEQLREIIIARSARSSVDGGSLRDERSVISDSRRSSVASSRRGSLASNAASRRLSRVHPIAIERFPPPQRRHSDGGLTGTTVGYVPVLAVYLIMRRALLGMLCGVGYACRFNERVWAVFERTGQLMSAIVLEVNDDTLEVVWEEARWYCNIQGNDKSECIVPKTAARNAQGQLCRQPSTGTGAGGDPFTGGSGGGSGSVDGRGIPTAVVIVIVVASVVILCGGVYYGIRRSARSLDLSSPKNDESRKLGRGFTDTISRMLEDDEKTRKVRPVKDIEDLVPEIASSISISVKKAEANSNQSAEASQYDMSRKSSVAISEDGIQQIRAAAA